ncbi:LptA/OstA family protein [Hyphococcus flavus]|uniref:LptA/OstA family protein n=1 Tax=Hyphococcus flavus TaxID=1866326 RepID=A0AAE9ZBQ5_9PROT|nr:LptA/OstA family protein [Hyphococcus flavus]WDI31763.1 LptA/OstA family protein [Hyphococcus flavus]
MNSKLLLLSSLSFLALGQVAKAQLVSDSDEPIDITGDTAEFQDNVAIWTGNVRVVQGEAILTTNRLEAILTEDGAFENIVAIGAVRYSNGKENITGEHAVFDEAAQTITMTEDVIVTQGKQVMSAGKVTYWVETGKVLFMPEPGKRIRGLFFTKSDKEPA